ncbi:hypothetical protein Tco_0773837 [Tanacetum coccineum]|uniref:Xylulose kinase-1 n=1 Tax=Tanacetum coccineum TaxID=301880 RepID=A0ABQ4ZPF3_9ASTR
MVAYLKKPIRSEGFQEIVYFLNESHIRFALTKNPTIYVSLIENFWQTATVRTVNNEEQEITATVDGKEFTITKASVRKHLQLADVDGISVLPTTEIFAQLSLMGYVLTDDKPTFQKAEEGEGSGHPSEPQPPPSIAQPIHEEPIPNIPIPNVPDEAVYEEWDDRVERATTTAASLDAAQASGNITKTQSMVIPNVPLPQKIGAGGSPRFQEATGGSIAQTRSERVPIPPHDSPLPRVNTLGSDEGSMSLQELTVLCIKLFSKVESLEVDLKQTKQVYGAAYTKLIMKVKKLKKTVKTSQARRRAKIVVSDDEEDLEDSSKQGRMIEEINQDAGVTLVTPTHSQEDQPEDQFRVFSAAKVLADAAKNVHTYTRIRKVVSTSSGGVSTASRLFSTAEELVSNAGASMPVSTASTIQEVNKDKAAVRLQEQRNKEERQRIVRMHEEAKSFNIEEWENIQATIEADEELAQRIQAEEREKKYSEAEKARLLAELINKRKRYFAQQRAKERRNKPLTQAQQRTYMSNYIKHIGSNTLQQLKRLSFDELKAFSKGDAEVELDHEGSKKQKTNEASSTTEPTDDKEKELWVELKRLFEPDSDDTLWKLQSRERLSVVKMSSDVDVGYQAVSRTTFRDGK